MNVKIKERITTIQFGDMLAEMLDLCQMNVRVSKKIQVIYNINCYKKTIEEVVMTTDLKTVTLVLAFNKDRDHGCSEYNSAYRYGFRAGCESIR